MSENRIPKRSEVKKENTWAVEDIFPSDQAWSEAYEQLKALPAQAAAFKGILGRSAADLLAFFKQRDDANYRMGLLFNYASRNADADTGNGFYQDMRNKAMSLSVALSSASAYAVPEILEIDDAVLEGFYTDEPQLETYRRPIEKIRHQKEHTLSPAEEALLAAAENTQAAKPRSIVIPCGTSIAPVMAKWMEKYGPDGISVTVLPVKNTFFGETVTVTGLLTGGDLIRALKDRTEDEAILCGNTLREEGDLFLDDTSLDTLRASIPMKLTVTPNGGAHLFQALLGLE